MSEATSRGKSLSVRFHALSSKDAARLVRVAEYRGLWSWSVDGSEMEVSAFRATLANIRRRGSIQHRPRRSKVHRTSTESA